MEEERPEVGSASAEAQDTDPFRDDPVFKTKKAVRKYLTINVASSEESGEEAQIEDTHEETILRGGVSYWVSFRITES